MRKEPGSVYDKWNISVVIKRRGSQMGRYSLAEFLFNMLMLII
jgi:hypothetical protein